MIPTQSALLGVAEDAQRHLHNQLHASGRQISCDFRDGVLYLRGRSRSFYQKQVAQEAVRRVEGVIQVVNEIQVVSPPA
ncbi:MAG: BON domain-containing protein [Planctomycetota bacterium]|nr:BON domain-containing protein [Planctomycetota bacterium]